MRTLHRIGLLVVLLALPACGAKDPTQPTEPKAKETPTKPVPEGWTRFTPKDGGFTVHFPAKPEVRPASAASHNFHVAGVQRRSVENLGYVCQWQAREKPFTNKTEEAVYLRGQQAGVLGSLKGAKLATEKELTLDGVVGREFIVEAPNQNCLRNRSYVAGKRIITLQVWGKDRDALNSKDAETFLESLQIIP